MAQDSETRRSTVAAGARAGELREVPGLLPGAAAVILSGLIFWIWLASGAGNVMMPDGAAGSVTSELAQVDDQDVTAALATMEGPTAFLARFKTRTAGCPEPLAWVALARAPGQPAGTVRLGSGGYYSPVFDLSDVPVRVAIPYPGPYESGHGTLTVMGAGGRATVALRPAWQVPTQGGAATREVTWHAGDRCKSTRG
jgi:hypothetical protein